ncbi:MULTISPECIES: hypothetical protein [unclassified Chryseobacterium]|uniref:hypothetical protein n=1 Tax=unclassified Chryseobacterium TaxID=2593645 RepID=UPI000D3DA4D1|nr:MULTISPECIES: hypothetical protein [unclassified Chryseobacterium]PVV50767.1 hypothetical protein DD829_21425 [Chryseobacterium sp. HMWF035]
MKKATDEEHSHDKLMDHLESTPENQHSIAPDLSFTAIKNGKVWKIDPETGGKEIALHEINESLVGYEYESPKLYISSELVDFFTALVGDHNPHYHEDFAQQTQL